MNIYAIVGAGGFGREVMPLVVEMLNRVPDSKNSKAIFVDDNPPSRIINGFEVMTTADFIDMDETLFFNIAIANSKIRELVANKLIGGGAKPFAISAANTLNLAHNEIGEGSILCPFTTVTANARIGKFFHSNIYSYVAHDCVIGDFVTFAPGVHCNGSVIIEDHAYIGTGAIIKQGTPDRPIVIGKGAVVGMGAVVTKSVEPFTTVVGNPARPLVK